MNMYLRQLYLSQLYLNQLQNQFFLRGGSGRGGSGRGGSGRGGSGGEDNSTFGDRLAALRSDSAAQEESQQENRDYQRLVEISVRENHRSGGFKGTHGNHCTLVFMLHYLQDDGRVKPIEGPHLSIYDSVPGKSDGTLPDGIPFKKVYGKIHVFEPFLTSKLSVINQVYNYGKPDTSVSNRHFHKALYKAIPNDSLRDQLLKDLVQKHIYTPDYAKLHNIRRDALLPINKNSINNILGRVNSFLRERPSGQLAATADSAATMVVLAGQAVAETSSIMPTSGQAAAQLVEVAGQPTEEELSAAWAAAMETPIVEDEEEVPRYVAPRRPGFAATPPPGSNMTAAMMRDRGGLSQSLFII